MAASVYLAPEAHADQHTNPAAQGGTCNNGVWEEVLQEECDPSDPRYQDDPFSQCGPARYCHECQCKELTCSITIRGPEGNEILKRENLSVGQHIPLEDIQRELENLRGQYCTRSQYECRYVPYTEEAVCYPDVRHLGRDDAYRQGCYLSASTTGQIPCPCPGCPEDSIVIDYETEEQFYELLRTRCTGVGSQWDMSKACYEVVNKYDLQDGVKRRCVRCLPGRFQCCGVTDFAIQPEDDIESIQSRLDEDYNIKLVGRGDDEYTTEVCVGSCVEQIDPACGVSCQSGRPVPGTGFTALSGLNDYLALCCACRGPIIEECVSNLPECAAGFQGPEVECKCISETDSIGQGSAPHCDNRFLIEDEKYQSYVVAKSGTVLVQRTQKQGDGICTCECAANACGTRVQVPAGAQCHSILQTDLV